MALRNAFEDLALESTLQALRLAALVPGDEEVLELRDVLDDERGVLRGERALRPAVQQHPQQHLAARREQGDQQVVLVAVAGGRPSPCQGACREDGQARPPSWVYGHTRPL